MHIPRPGRLVSPLPRSLRRTTSACARADEFEEAGLLGDLSGAERAARVDVLTRLVESGESLDELVHATRSGQLAHLLLEHALSPQGKYSLGDIARLSGLSELEVRRWFRVIGRGVSTNEGFYNDGDLALAKAFQEYRKLGLDEKAVFAAARVMGRNIWTVADAADVLLQDRLDAAREHPELALRYSEEIRRLAEYQAQILAQILATNIRYRIHADAVGVQGSEFHLPDAGTMGVCFADLVGFTLLGERGTADDLGRVAANLDRLASDVVSPPVRVVKTIGDAVMMVAPNADGLAAATLDLVEAARGAGLPPLRAGIAWGSAMHSSGDWFGRPVNLASRVVAVAPAHEVLVTGDFYDQLDTDSFWCEPAGSFRLKGLDLPQELLVIGRRQVA
ncbi:adenylate/guanylate cyclase domain-containing protein [Rhodococcus sp. NPDC058521]|uniref:adenylate/guanylate cyclase domain-containing protein n=1 Tax=Rhodococcus sp. NPDC058521 TaxID=3346536 RepID=UPI00364EB3A3